MEMASACTVLVVEDEPLIRAHLVEILEGKGCKTYEAANAAEAIAILEQNSEITVVFTDIHMPGTMDGRPSWAVWYVERSKRSYYVGIAVNLGSTWPWSTEFDLVRLCLEGHA
jgi:hypothetical protein